MKRLLLGLALALAASGGPSQTVRPSGITYWPADCTPDRPSGITYVPDPCGGATTTAFTSLVSAYWSLDDQFFGASANYEAKVADSSLDLTPTNDPLRAPYANRLPAAQFVDGNSEYLSVADPWTSGDIDFSVGCWVYLDDLTGDLPIASKDDGTQQEWRLYYDDNTTDAWVFEIFDGAGGSRGTVSKTTPAPAATTWFFVVGAHDATNNEVGVSVNGSAYTTAATSGVAVDTDDPFELGRMTAATYHDGRLSQCFFIKEELSAADLGDLYNNGIPVPSRQFAQRVATAAEGLWDLSELSGNRSDFTANAVTLTDNASVLHGAGLAPRAYKAADFEDSNTEYLSRASESQFVPGDTDFSWWGWVRLESAGAAGVFGKYDNAGASTDGEWGIVADTLDYICRISDGATRVQTAIDNTGNLAADENVWHLLVCVHDADADTLGGSGDGDNLVTVATGGVSPQDDSKAIAFGAESDGGLPYDGMIGPAGWHNGTALTNAQIAKLYAGGQAFSCDSLPADFPAPTVCWDLDEPSGTRSASIGDADLADNNTVGQGDGIADIPGGVTLRAAQFVHTANESLSHTGGGTVLDVGADVEFAVSAFVRIDDTTGAEHVIYKGDGGSTAADLEYALRGSGSPPQWGFEISDGTNLRTAQGTGGDADVPGQWQHVVGVFDPSANLVHVYLNGTELDNTATSTSFPQDIDEDFVVGARGASDTSMTLSHLAVFKGTGAALSSAEVQTLFNSGDVPRCEDIEALVGVAPVECWDMDEDSGNRTGAIAGVVLIDNNTVTSTGGLIRGRTGHAVDNVRAESTYFTLSDAAAISFDEEFSAWGWVYLLNDSTSQYFWGKRGSLNSSREYHLFSTTGEAFSFAVDDGGGTGGSVDSPTPAATTDQWVFVAVSHDPTNNELKMWVQGTEVAASPASYSLGMQDAANGLSLGRPGDWNANYSDDPQDEFAVGAFVLTDTQVTCLYNSGLGRSYADLVAGVCDE